MRRSRFTEEQITATVMTCQYRCRHG